MSRAGSDTRGRVVEAALAAFGRKGYDGTSLDALAGELGVTKQTILYYFSTKEALLDATVDSAAREVSAALAAAVSSSRESAGTAGGSASGVVSAWDRVEAIVRAVFRVAAGRPELLGLMREVSRIGPPPATRFAATMEPLIDGATRYLEAAMRRGELREQDTRLLLFMAYASVVGVATEIEVLRALGVETTARSTVRQRRALLGFLRSALVPG